MEITVKQMMQIEENGHQMGFLRKFMMENAGAAAVKRLAEKFSNFSSKKITVFAGLGNNGGDAMVMARHLAGYGANIIVVVLGDPQKIKTEESRWNFGILKKTLSSMEFWVQEFLETLENHMHQQFNISTTPKHSSLL